MRLSSITLVLALALSGNAARAVEEPVPAVPAAKPVPLTAADQDALQKLFAQLGKGFLSGSADDCLAVFVPKTAELRLVPQALREEFGQTAYTRFEAAEIRASDAESLRANVWIVDVVLLLESAPKHAPAEALQKDRAYKTSYPFIVQRMPDGAFLLRHSEFFQTLGLRRGPGLLLKGVGMLAAFSAFLAFWVWMGWEAWRERPRSKFWRVCVLIPGVGATGYFVLIVLPRWLKRSA